MVSQTNWHPADVIAAVRKSGSTMQAIALAAGFHRTAASHCLSWPVPHANKAIADHLGKSVSDLWPQWFDEDGEVRADWKKITIRTAPAQRQKWSAA